jgi:prepilin-type N-terminal cleavage/methylation domain-containing protein
VTRLASQMQRNPRWWRLHVHRERSYTLIELLITVAIIAILAAIGIPNFLQAQVRSKVASAVTNQSLIASALESYYVDYEQYPMNNLLVETVVPVSPLDVQRRGMPHPDVFARSPFVGRGESEPIFSEIRETTGILAADWYVEGAAPPFISAEAGTTTRTVVREIPYSSSIPVEAHAWRVCRNCGALNAETETHCTDCRFPLTDSELRMIYNQSLNGEVLSVLTTPIAYLPTEVNDDTFNRRASGGRGYGKPQAFSYVNYLQLNPEGLAIPHISPNAHYALMSYGPDTRLDYIHASPVPYVSIYDPTNGTISAGDIINFGQ